MSYILEAIKKAESERGNKRLSQTAINEALERSNTISRIPWVAVAIFINAIILLGWIGYQVLNKQHSSDEPFDSLGVKHNSQAQLSTNGETLEYQEQDVNVIDSDSSEPKLQSVNEAAQIHMPALAEKSHAIDADGDAEPAEASTNSVALEDKNNEFPPISIDEMIEQDVPEFFSVKKPIQEEVVRDQSHEEIMHSYEGDTNASNRFVVAKIEPMPKVEESEPSVAEVLENIAVETTRVDAVSLVPTVENQDVPSIEELPYSMQKQIPNLAISVHIYNVEKQSRKVRVNGSLLYEGDQVDDVTVEEITPRGVIFDYEGTLFRKNLH